MKNSLKCTEPLQGHVDVKSMRWEDYIKLYFIAFALSPKCLALPREDTLCMLANNFFVNKCKVSLWNIKYLGDNTKALTFFSHFHFSITMYHLGASYK